MHFVEWKFCITIKIQLKFAPKVSNENNLALV